MENESPERTKDSNPGVSQEVTDMDLLSGGADISTTAASPLKLTKKSTFGKPSAMMEGGTDRRLDSIYTMEGSNIIDPLQESVNNVHHASMQAHASITPTILPHKHIVNKKHSIERIGAVHKTGRMNA